MKKYTLYLGVILSCMILTGCGNSAENAVSEEEQEVLSDHEMEEPETVEEKDYDPTDYMEYEIVSSYFLADGSKGYELVIAQENENEEQAAAEYARDVKVFVSRLTDDVYCLQQVLEDKEHDGGAWDSQGLYLVDANFDGEKDILVQNGHYGNQGAQCYSCYLLEDGKYVQCNGFEEIPNASVDEENKVILGSWRSSASSHGWGVYAYENGEYHLQRCLTEEYRVNENNSDEYVIYWTEEEFDENELALPDSEGKGKVTWQMNDLDCDEEMIQGKLYGESSFWKLDDYYKWNSLERIEYWGASLLESGKVMEDEGDYFTDKLLFLGEFPIEESLNGRDEKNILLYGVRKEAPDSVILWLGDEYYQIRWYWGNNYQVYPELICQDVDGDGKSEIVMKALNKTGTGWRVETLCICDFEDGDLQAHTLYSEEILSQIQEQIEYNYIKEKNSVQFLQNGKVICEVALPDWTEEYPYAGEVTYDSYISFDIENMTMEVKPQIQLEASLPYEEIALQFKVEYKEGEMALKYLKYFSYNN